MKQLRELYDVVILCYGADVDSQLGIPGEESNNVISARDFVAWYNGFPYDKKLEPDLSGTEAIVIGKKIDKFHLKNFKLCLSGQGNVAIDVAR